MYGFHFKFIFLFKYIPLWEKAVKVFKKQGLSELDALQQARVAYILRAKDIGDVDCLAEKGIKLWTPETTGNTAKHQKTFL